MPNHQSGYVLAALLLSGTLFPTFAHAQEPIPGFGDPIIDPIPGEPVLERLALELEEFVAIPKSVPTPLATDRRINRHARINYIGEIPDGSGRMYVPDLNGMMYVVVDGEPLPYHDIGADFEPEFYASGGLGSGFGFVTFHPSFAENGIFYTVHTERDEDEAPISERPDLTFQPGTEYHGIITEWTAKDPSANTFRGDRREVLRLGFRTRIHGIQQIAFNPNAKPGDEDYGLLYIAAGDGGFGRETGDPQDLSTPQGKILRIDPAGKNSNNGQYGIPATNPFIGKAGAIGEIFAYGVRDPHRFSWDVAGDQRMFLGHMGEKDIEMIYDILPGDNFGWSAREGRFVHLRSDRCHLYPLPENDEEFGFIYPIAEFDHNRPPGLSCGRDAGHAISGGFVYRGEIEELQGKYIFGDVVDGRVLYLEESDMIRARDHRAAIHEMTVIDPSGTEMSMAQLVGDSRVDLRFGTDTKHNLYLLSKANGKVWKVTGTRSIDNDNVVFPSLAPNLQAFYDFDHPVDGGDLEQDLGLSRTNIELINGGKDMRIEDAAYAASQSSVRVKQVDESHAGNDDWKAGLFDEAGVDSLSAFASAKGITIMTWVKMEGDGPAPNTNSEDEPDDIYNAMGLVGILSGNSDGHGVRALIELIKIDGTLRLVALGRRLDEGKSQIYAAEDDWRELLPKGEWAHLAAVFDFTNGNLALYRNGSPIAGFNVKTDDPWEVGEGGDFKTSPTNPRGIKIGGSFPQGTSEKNPGLSQLDGVMLIDRAVTQLEVSQQYRRMN